ncbi:hypothetical protein [Amycolatopsis sp. lyj-346]|uniref:hypothetical protein n=1 Tax=Amycolatopsis sp. lyj-346 TaxID=2789289 RepID=UPI00397A981A
MTTHVLGDTTVLLGRSLRHVTRSLDTIITTVITPVAMMLMFVYVFGGAIDTGSASYVNYMLPGILLLFTLALTWVALIAGLTAKKAEGGGAFSYPLIFLPFLSSAFVPTGTMPGPVRWFADQPVGTDIWIALAWCAGILVVAYVFATAAYRRKVS